MMWLQHFPTQPYYGKKITTPMIRIELLQYHCVAAKELQEQCQVVLTDFHEICLVDYLVSHTESDSENSLGKIPKKEKYNIDSTPTTGSKLYK